MASQYEFRVLIPVVVAGRSSIESSSATSLPIGVFGEIDVSRVDDEYTVTLAIVAESPGAAKGAGLDIVEDLLRLLAAANDAFRTRPGGIAAEIVRKVSNGGGDHLFLDSHLGTDKVKGSLRHEAEQLGRRSQWPEGLRDALELNYLAVLSERDGARWLLETAALERLADGRLGPRKRLLAGRLQAEQVTALKTNLRDLFAKAGLMDDEIDRLVGRVADAEGQRAAEHIHRYLTDLHVEASPEEVARWWAGRGPRAHGRTGEVDSSDLSRLVSRTQLALAQELESLGG